MIRIKSLLDQAAAQQVTYLSKNTSSRPVRSQVTASSFRTDEHATLKDLVVSKCLISSEISCSESLFTCEEERTM